MNKKQLISLIVSIIGAVLIFFAIHAKGQVDAAGTKVNALTSPFSSTPAGGATRRMADEKLGGYYQEVQMLMIAGIVLLIAGGASYYYCRKKRSK